MPLMNPAELETLRKVVAEVNDWMGNNCPAEATPRTGIALLREVALAVAEATPALPAYDPNIRWAKHVIEITYQQWDYRLTVEVEIGGNLHGAEVLEYAISTHADDLLQAQGEFPMLVLRRPAADGSDGEDTLEVFADDGDIEDFLTDMCVGLRIVCHEREDRK